jgi:hypothetical protein
MEEIKTDEIYKIEETKKSSKKGTAKANSGTFTFKSYHRGTIIFITPDEYIKFVNHIYNTTDEEIAQKLRDHPAFGKEIFEGEFPPEIIEKFKKSKEFLTYINPEEVGEA